eukprot:TRINITY_DN5931_c0_g1_i6.p2 TRINITY_DN5931_c0_g1~~TRINITY_DN5931_c0_g1_i6.p2  ORF type:complete len:211 (-),score=13.84 TRINITY_DN5931_c0_g1_i6:249-881(-)
MKKNYQQIKEIIKKIKSNKYTIAITLFKYIKFSFKQLKYFQVKRKNIQKVQMYYNQVPYQMQSTQFAKPYQMNPQNNVGQQFSGIQFNQASIGDDFQVPSNLNQNITVGQPVSLIVQQPFLITGQLANHQLSYSADGIGYPVRIICPSCKNEITTYVKQEVGFSTVFCCFFLGFTIGCCCLPFFIQDCQDKVHYCPQCRSQVGKKEYVIC